MLPEASRSLLRNFFRLRSMPASSVFTDMYVLRSSPSFCCNTAMRCEASSSGSVTGNISTSTQHLSFINPISTRASKTKSKQWVIRLYLCPQVVYMSFPNPHYFVTIFNLLVIITISFCSYTNFGMGVLYLYEDWVWVCVCCRLRICQYHYPSTAQPSFNKQ